MERSVPLWLVLLLGLVGFVLTVGFGAVVLVTQRGSSTFGALGQAAVAMAAFPSQARDTLRDLWYRTRERDSDYLTVRQFPAPDLEGFRPLAQAPGLGLDPPLVRADPARLPRGHRILVGVFRFTDGHANAALLLDPELKVIKTWKLIPSAGDDHPTPIARRLVHEVDFLPADGSFLYNVTPSAGLIRRDACGKVIWSIPGEYHHAITLDEDRRTAWATFDREVTQLHQVDMATGRVVRRLPFMAIAQANPEIEIWRVRTTNAEQLVGIRNNRGKPFKWFPDPFHTNDADPLPRALAAAFPMFAPGDLVLSNRELNQLVVIDPETRKVKWWHAGDWDHQHDPDWLPDGTIAVFDNRARLGGYSRIVTIDPATRTVRVPVDGRKIGFYSLARGKMEPTPSGGFLVASAFQGRIFETDRDGRVVFDLWNPRGDDPALMFMTTQAFFFPEGRLDWSRWPCKPVS